MPATCAHHVTSSAVVRWRGLVISVPAVIVTSAAISAAAFLALFTTFYEGDDEGFFLLGARNFSEHGHLYSRIFASVYGPFPYLIHAALHRFGFVLGTDYARWFALTLWLGTALMSGAIARTVTKSWLYFAVTAWFVSSYLVMTISEPFHPALVVTFLVAVIAWAGCRMSSAAHAAIAGALTACILFAKVNCGIFVAVACLIWLVLPSLRNRMRAIGRLLVVLASTSLVLLLMRPLIVQSWVQLLALVFVAAVVNATVLLSRVESPERPGWAIHSYVGAAGATSIVIMTLTAVTGTPLSQLVGSMVLNSLKFAGEWAVPFAWLRGTLLSALAAVVVCAMTNHRPDDIRLVRFIVWSRLAVVVFLVWQISRLEWFTVDVSRYAMSYGVAWAWLFVPSLSTTEGRDARAWLALLLVFCVLQAYPIAGVQVVWGTFLIIPLWILGIADSVPIAAAVAPLRNSRLRFVITTAVAAIIVWSVVATVGVGFSRYRSARPIGLPGAMRTRLDPETQSAIRILVSNVQAHADVLFSLPGLWSTNFWSGVPPPTLANSAAWYTQLGEVEQQHTIEAMTRSARPCVIVRPDILKQFLRQGPQPTGPLFGWLQANFERKFAVGRYELWARRDRRLAALSTVAVQRLSERDSDVVMTVDHLTNAIASIHVADVADAGAAISAAGIGSAVVVTPIDRSGTPVAGDRRTFLPVQPEGMSRVAFRLRTSAGRGIPAGRMFVVLLDTEGSVIGELRESS
jgi:hypothetical protein